MDVLKRIIPHLLLNLRFFPDVSLFHGKMGGVLFFYEYSRCTHEVAYENFASDLLDDFYHNIKVNTPINFENGLSGIGWGLQYLIQQRFIDADPDVILQDIDSEIIKYTPEKMTDLSFNTGLLGITFYILSRIKTSSRIDKTVFDKDYLMHIYKCLCRDYIICNEHNKDILQNLKQCLAINDYTMQSSVAITNFIMNKNINVNDLQSAPLGLCNGLIGLAWRSILPNQ